MCHVSSPLISLAKSHLMIKICATFSFPICLSFCFEMGWMLHITRTNHNSCCGSFHSLFFSGTRAQLQLLLLLPQYSSYALLSAATNVTFSRKHDRNFNLFFALLSKRKKMRKELPSSLFVEENEKWQGYSTFPLRSCITFLWLVFDFLFESEFALAKTASLHCIAWEYGRGGQRTGQHSVIFFPLFKLIELHLNKKGTRDSVLNISSFSPGTWFHVSITLWVRSSG